MRKRSSALLLHDIGDTLAPENHAQLGAAVLRPYISEDNHWLIKNHAIFQGYYYYHHIGLNRDERDRYRGHPMFQRTADFCEKYDQNSFDPNYDTMPLEAARADAEPPVLAQAFFLRQLAFPAGSMVPADEIFSDPAFARLYDAFNLWGPGDDFYLALARKLGGGVLDLGCGTGMLACRIAQRCCPRCWRRSGHGNAWRGARPAWR